MSKKAKILIVDDEPRNLIILKEYLEDAGHETVPATNGMEAWSLLEQNDPDYFDVILLDRMMPVMDGMEALRKIRDHRDFRTIPVIMQTAAGDRHQILEGLQAGCYYYLVKPFDEELLLSVISNAIVDSENFHAIKKETQKHALSLSLLETGRFRFKTLDEGRALAAILASTCNDPDRVALGLTELFINAVEHGNLEISYSDKTALLENGEWDQEIERRLSLPGYADRVVSVEFRRQPDKLGFVVSDEGNGFEWQSYLDFKPEQMLGSHGRGIIMASTMCFDVVEYNDTGSQVTASVNVN